MRYKEELPALLHPIGEDREESRILCTAMSWLPARLRGRFTFLGLSLLILFVLIYFFSDVVTYVLLAFVISLVGQPIMRFFLYRFNLRKIRGGAPISAILTILVIGLFAGTLLYISVPVIVSQARTLAEVDYLSIVQALDEPLNEFRDYLAQFGIELSEEAASRQLQIALKGWFEPAQIGNFFGSFLFIASDLIIGLFSVVFISFFFLQEQGMLKHFILTLVPTSYESQVRNVIEDAMILLRRYFGGVILQIVIICVFVTLSLTLLGIKNALLIGLFAATMNVIPYLGPLIGAGFGVMITISSNLDVSFYDEMIPLLIKVLCVFGAVQLLDNFVLQPYIYSNRVLAHPLEIFIIILVAAKIYGILGMILAIPTYTVIRVIARTFLSEFKLVQEITRSMEKRKE